MSLDDEISQDEVLQKKLFIQGNIIEGVAKIVLLLPKKLI